MYGNESTIQILNKNQNTADTGLCFILYGGRMYGNESTIQILNKNQWS